MSTGWTIGLILGVVVILVAAAIVITIVMLAQRIAEQARTAVDGVTTVRQQTDGLRGHRPHQRLGRAHPALRARAAEGGGGQMTNDDAWVLALIIGLVAALIVAALLLILLIRAVRDIESSIDALLEVAGKVGANTANIPQLEATAPVLAHDRRRGHRPGRLHERAHRRLRRGDGMTVAEHPAGGRRHRRARRRADRGPPRPAPRSRNLATLAGALEGVEAEHLRPLEPAVKAINAQFDIILSALPGIGAKAAVVAERRPR